MCVIDMYHTAGYFGGTKFWQIAKLWGFRSFNLANLWLCAIEHAHNGSKWLVLYFVNGYQNAKFAKFSSSKISCCMVI